MDGVARLAAANNAEWCDVVCRSPAADPTFDEHEPNPDAVGFRVLFDAEWIVRSGRPLEFADRAERGGVLAGGEGSSGTCRCSRT